MMQTSRFVLIVTFLGCLIMNGSPPVFSSAATPGYTPMHSTDSTLTERVHHALKNVSGLKLETLQLRIQKGVVVVSGTVDNLLRKDRITRILERKRGVRSVVNNLVIRSSRADTLIERDLKRVLNENPTTLKWKVWGRVQDNVITLNGIVDNWRTRDYIEELCKGIKGVKAIRNKIQIDRQNKLTDAELEKQIESYLKWDTRIDDKRLDIIVNNRKALLVGTVPNAYQKRMAIEQSHIPGITAVKAGNLDINPAGKAHMQRTDLNRSSSPDQIKKAVRQALSYDPRIEDHRQITLKFKNDTLLINGYADHLVEKLAIGEIAAHTVGVQFVNNNLSIDRQLNEEAPISLTDQAIQIRLGEAFQRDPNLSSADIQFTVQKGMVTLRGTVHSTYEKIHAGKVASQIMGTIGVNNELKVREGT